MMVAAAGGTRRSGFHMSKNGCSMPVAIVPEMLAAALQLRTAIREPGFRAPVGKNIDYRDNRIVYNDMTQPLSNRYIK